MVWAEGLDPHDSYHWTLDPAGLPIPPRRHRTKWLEPASRRLIDRAAVAGLMSHLDLSINHCDRGAGVVAESLFQALRLSVPPPCLVLQGVKRYRNTFDVIIHENPPQGLIRRNDPIAMVNAILMIG